MPTYHEIMNTDLGLLTTAAAKWDAMAGEMHKVEIRYGETVQKISTGQNWVGVSAGTAQSGFAATRYEYSASQIQAKAIASLLRDAHEQFTDLKKRVESARTDAMAAGMTVSEQGRVAFDYAGLTPAERSAYHHDPDGETSIRTAVAKWQQHIDDRVKAVTQADQHVRTALDAAVVDSNKDNFGKGADQTLSGFNAGAEGDLAKVPMPGTADKDATTTTDGWQSEGKTSATGPAAGAAAYGPQYGKEASAKAYADLGHATAEGSLTNGSMKLSGIADAYAGARATANVGFTDGGLTGKAEASVGGRALAEGRAEYGHMGYYMRGEGFAGAEAGVSAGASLSGVNAGAKAFAGAKATYAGGGELAGIGAGGTAEGWAGAGVEAKVTFGKGEDGKFHIGGEAGVALGLGGKLGGEFTVDPAKVSAAASDAANAVGDAANAVGDAAGSVKDEVTSWFD
ncbi:hypothetical protein ABZ891_19735 [Streptomyces sp. NPDC047023]|uniref:hypothetical protein n=1 Tax=Streptomyces sp. NPDC047023 TaxID=3155139 RepID=UPI0033CDDA18